MGYYPYVYKNGLLIFTPKQGKDPKLPENYRPITLLEVPGKILERIINDRFMYFLCTFVNIMIYSVGVNSGFGIGKGRTWQ